VVVSCVGHLASILLSYCYTYVYVCWLINSLNEKKNKIIDLMRCSTCCTGPADVAAYRLSVPLVLLLLAMQAVLMTSDAAPTSAAADGAVERTASLAPWLQEPRGTVRHRSPRSASRHHHVRRHLRLIRQVTARTIEIAEHLVARHVSRQTMLFNSENG